MDFATGTAARPGRSPSWGLLLVAAGILVLWLWFSLPLALGDKTLIFRDISSLHFPLKAFGARELAAGHVPALNPSWGLGQPFRGNPQTLAFYPDNVLYLLFAFWSAFNLHYVLHALLALVAMALLAREMGLSPAAALMAGVTYAGSGWGLTSLSFYHIVTVSAWWPLTLWGGLKGGPRGIALGGLACGLALLGGEPMLAALGCLPLLVAAVLRHGARKGILTAVAIGALGLLVALPQAVASLRILPFTFRGAAGLPITHVSFYSLHPLRFVELFLPLPFGWPTTFESHGWWAEALLGRIPLILSIYPGIVGLGLAVAGALPAREGAPTPASRSTRVAWTAVALAGYLLAWLGGGLSGPLKAVSGGLFRYPEKFLFWPALAVALLAAIGLDRVLARPTAWVRGAVVAAAASLTLAAVVFADANHLLPLLESVVSPGRPADTALAQLTLWILALLIAAILLGLAAWAVRRRNGAALVALQVLALAQLFPLVPRDDTVHYRDPSTWAQRLLAEDPSPAVVNDTISSSFLTPRATYRTNVLSVVGQTRIAAEDLDATPGVLFGFRYPMAPDTDGLFSPLSTLMINNLPLLDVRARANWMRVLGVEAVASYQDWGIPQLETVDEEVRSGVPTYLLRLRSPAPQVWWPRSVTPAADPMQALVAVGRSEDPISRVVTPQPVDHDPSGRVELVSASADRIELVAASAGGGVAVVQRAYLPILLAEDLGAPDAPGVEPRRLSTLPVDLHLLGVLVPPGRHRIVLRVSQRPEIAAAAVAVMTVIFLLGVAVGPRRLLFLRRAGGGGPQA